MVIGIKNQPGTASGGPAVMLICAFYPSMDKPTKPILSFLTITGPLRFENLVERALFEESGRKQSRTKTNQIFGRRKEPSTSPLVAQICIRTVLILPLVA